MVHAVADAADDGQLEAAVGRQALGGHVVGVVGPCQGGQGVEFHIEGGVVAGHGEAPRAVGVVRHRRRGVGGDGDTGDVDLGAIRGGIGIGHHPGVAGGGHVHHGGQGECGIAVSQDDVAVGVAQAVGSAYSSHDRTCLWRAVKCVAAFVEMKVIGRGDAGQLEAWCQGVALHEGGDVHRSGELLRGSGGPRGSCHAEEHQRQEQNVFCKCLHVVLFFFVCFSFL